jgi:hypothetical protein
MNRRTTRILASGAGINLIYKEESNSLLKSTLKDNVIGSDSVRILTSEGLIPIVPSRFIRDAAPAGAAYDEVSFWFINDEEWVWKGVYPYMGRKTFEPQLMDVTSTAPNGEILTDQRMLVVYGTPYAKNKGESIHRLVVRCRRGSAWNI